MAQSFETIAAFRFGLGFAPGQADVASAEALVAQTRGPDTMAEVYPGVSLAERVALNERLARQKRERKKDKKGEESKALRQTKRDRSAAIGNDAKRLFLRALYSPTSFRERLAFFWADHFTVAPKTSYGKITWGDYIDTAIRANIGNSFGDMLVAVVSHPNMLLFLDQRDSIGPNSRQGGKKAKGLNENLAREILELHTLGVGGTYSQTDVRELAELLTGLTVGKEGMEFQPGRAEPGAEQVLGKSYGGRGKADLADIEAFLRDVARHPDTAAHVARKLAVHFVDDDPDAGLVAQMTETYVATDGDLPSVYGAMLDHPAAWAPLGGKAKQPLDFMISGLRALGVPPKEFEDMPFRQVNRALAQPLAAMGQPLLRAPGPNGWPEEAEAWITAQGLAARLQWALLNAQRFGNGQDPRDFVEFALRDLAGDSLRRAVAGSEDKIEGLTLVLASPEFNRR